VSGSRDYVLLDVFTDTPLEGNQLAVFPDAVGLSSVDMQMLAREMNLSETVFVGAPDHGGDAAVRIFTPAAELPFAGHPVLGSAVVVGDALGLEQVTLETQAGMVPVRVRRRSERVAEGWMSQPIPTWRPFEREAELLAALGVGRSALPIEVYTNGPQHLYVALDTAGAVEELRVDMRALHELGDVGVSCFAGERSRWKTRVFAPALGVPEDPATGSAAGPLAVHLARHGRIAFGQEIEIRQGAEIGRPSLLRARVEGSAERIERVEVGGSAVIVARGRFLLG
jgi:trans-2,3-dihydro-3-hydroxyanthranilate isomerase